ncbi:hypothetical protein BH10PLA1_BH10PLA1_20370 [soil metagenome]
MHESSYFASLAKKTSRGKTGNALWNVESLEERTLFSAGMPLQGVIIESAQPQTDVYVMPLQVAGEPAKTVASPTIADSAAADRPHVTLRRSDDSGVLTGIYADSIAFRSAVHPTSSAVSEGGTGILARHDYDSFKGMPPSATPAKPAAKGTVLLIEDDATSRVALSTLLKRRGWKVVSASTMAEGMRQLMNEPENVIVDLMLPDGDGEQVLQEIRDSHLSAKVTVMTGVSDPARLNHLHELRPDHILSKPINLAALLRSLGPVN